MLLQTGYLIHIRVAVSDTEYFACVSFVLLIFFSTKLTYYHRTSMYLYRADNRPVRLAYKPPANSTFLSEQTSHRQPANTTFLSEQTSTSHQQPANRKRYTYIARNNPSVRQLWTNVT
jgi:hypothetical protein